MQPEILLKTSPHQIPIQNALPKTKVHNLSVLPYLPKTQLQPLHQLTLSGGLGNDTLIGVNPLSATPGTNETDVLIGGQGRDIFAIGDAATSYYKGTGFALIQDFQQGIDRIQLHGKLSDYSIVGNSINLAGTSDQVAVIQGGFTPDSFLFV